MLPSTYNDNVQIVPTKDYVLIHNEMVHNARVAPLVSKTTPGVPTWNGHSRARWEGDTLVVETKGFLGQTSFQNSSDKLHVVERFTRTDPDTLIYRFTINDPTTWTKPWTAEVPMVRSDEQMYGSAYHKAQTTAWRTCSRARATFRRKAARRRQPQRASRNGRTQELRNSGTQELRN